MRPTRLKVYVDGPRVGFAPQAVGARRAQVGALPDDTFKTADVNCVHVIACEGFAGAWGYR